MTSFFSQKNKPRNYGRISIFLIIHCCNAWDDKNTGESFKITTKIETGLSMSTGIRRS
jgi:hypothetical protein